MKILFIIDKLEFKYFEFNELVTDFWWIKEFLERGHEVYVSKMNDLSLKKDKPFANIYKSFVKENDIFHEDRAGNTELDNFDVIMFRADPPVDTDYINATYILDFVKRAKVINKPTSVRGFNEKLHAVLFSDLMPEYLVSANRNALETFLDKHGEIILKPMNKCFGAGVMYLKKGDFNTRSIINLVTNEETTLIMAQKYIPQAKDGDKRVLMVNGKVLPYGARKTSTKDDFKFNTHDDNFVKGEKLSIEEIELFTPVAQRLKTMGLYLAGLDVIDNKIIEVNITSPCYFIKEINKAFNIGFEKTIVDELINLINEL